MPVDLKIPELGESIQEVEIVEWLKAEGEAVAKDEDVVTLESEKASANLPSPVTGKLIKILRQQGSAKVGETIGRFEQGENVESAGAAEKAPPARARPSRRSARPGEKTAGQNEADSETRAGSERQRGATGTSPIPPQTKGRGQQKEPGAWKRGPSRTETKEAQPGPPASASETRVMPAARRLLDEHGLRADQIQATGPGGRLLKEDVLRHLEAEKQEPATEPPAPARSIVTGGREEEIVPLSPLRRTVARRLLEAAQTTAALTTFNEIDMSAVIALRNQHQERFQQKYQVKLGFMSFFVKAVIDALKLTPQLNAALRGDDIVYRNYFDIGVAIGSGRGLVVPVLRNAERLSFAEIETAIAGFAARAREGSLKLDELQGGTFTITNGGVYGSLLSTPLLNPPQSGILGMHAIQERPVAREGAVVIRPMMYVALTYDHRLVDGREAVTCLKRIKEAVETPARMLLEI